tara:strand:+ start:36 stop:521 length:486 start_codon:yes stop_codon:yes gene_type:complete
MIQNKLTYKKEIEFGFYNNEKYTEKVLAVYKNSTRLGFIIKDNDIKEYFFATSLDGSYIYSGITQRELKEILQSIFNEDIFVSDKDKFMQLKPIKIDSIINQLNQLVTFYLNPKNDNFPIVAIIDEYVFNTDFFDTDDFFDNSDYNPVLINKTIKLHYELI